MKRTAHIAVAAVWLVASIARAAPALEAYGRLPGVELMEMSPSGARYAFIATVGEKRQLAAVDVGGKPLFVSDVGVTKVRKLTWADDGHLLVTISQTLNTPSIFSQAFEGFGVIAFGMDGKARPIFKDWRNTASIVNGYFGSAKIDGHVYSYFRGLADVYRVDLDTGKMSLAVEVHPSDRDWVIESDGSVLAHSEYDESSGKWRLFAGKARSKAIMEKVSPFHDVGILGHGRGPGTVLVMDRSGDHDVLEEVSIIDGKIQTLLDNHEVRRLFFDPGNNHFIGANVAEESRTLFFDKNLQARVDGTRKAFPGYQVELESHSHDLERLIVTTDGNDDSGTYWLVDIATGKADPIGYSRPEIRPSDVGPTRLVTYRAGDGLDIEGVLTLPPGRKPERLPLVMLPHGGPIGICDRVGFDWWAQAYASAGYAVFQPNYRGSCGHSKSFRQAGFGQWGRKMQTDLSDGVAALVEQGIADRKRVCIVGASYGGYAALAGVTLQQGLYRCAVSVAGLSDLSTFFKWQTGRSVYANNNATRYWRALIGTDKDGDEVMRSLSPALLADHADAPVLLIHGKDDTVVPLKQSEEMVSALKSAGKHVEFVVMPGEDHWLSRESTRVTMLKAAVDFVKENNPAD